MWIKNLFINDFGCFQHEEIQDLSPGLNVIAGPQRAGKTTFMQIVRHLAYSIPDSEAIPPPQDPETGYELDAELDVDGREARLRRSGSGAPELTGVELERSEAVGGLSRFRYQLIFTISLEELRRIPALAADADELNLQAALVGGGWADLVHMPRLIEEFGGEAKDIAGKRGRFAYELKSPGEQLESGLAAREEAQAQVDEYRQVCQELESRESEIRELENDLEEMELESDRLTVLSDNYETYEAYVQLNERLDESARTLLEAYPDHGLQKAQELLRDFEAVESKLRDRRQNWEQAVGENEPEDNREIIEAHKQELTAYRDQLSGWRKIAGNLEELKQELKAKRDQLEEDLLGLHEAWQKSPEKLQEVNTDLVARDELFEVSRELQENRNQLEAKQSALADEREELREIETLTEQQEFSSWGLKLTFGGCFLFLVGLGLTVAGQTTAGVLTMVAGAALGSVAGYKVYDKRRQQADPAQLGLEMERQEREVNRLEEKVKDLEAEVERLEEKFQSMIRKLNLPETISPAGAKDYYQRLLNLKGDHREIQSLENELADKSEEFKEQLREVAELLEQFPDGSLPAVSVGNADIIFNRLEEKIQLVEPLKQLKRAEKDWAEFEKECLDLLEKGAEKTEKEQLVETPKQLKDGLRDFKEQGEKYEKLVEKLGELEEKRTSLESALGQEVATQTLAEYREGSTTEPWQLGAFGSIWEGYASREKVNSEREKIERQLEKQRQRLEELTEAQQDLKNKRDQLATDEKLRAANEQIQQARQLIEPKLEEYAVNRIAEFLVEKLYERYVEQARGGLLQEASELFRKMTGETYERVKPLRDDPSRADFIAEQAAGEEQTSVELSRGTREQLFLSVRLARIRDIEPPLPVILDDSAVNFDPAHRERTAKILSELAERNQIFVLTSHPELLEFIEANSESPSYRYINADHKFSSPQDSPQSLIEQLRE